MPSPKVATYDLQPEMSAAGVTDALVAAIESDDYDFIVANFANPDMVGHTGVWTATVTRPRVRRRLPGPRGRRRAGGGRPILAARVGRALCSASPPTTATPTRCASAGAAVTAHSLNPVPLVLVGAARREAGAARRRPRRRRADAPGAGRGGAIEGMTGSSLLEPAPAGRS